MAIRIAMLKNNGWSLEGLSQVLDPNSLPLSITNSTDSTFTASYKGIDYVFQMQDLRLFLTRSYLYLPYPKFLSLELGKEYMNVGETQELKILMYYTNGDVANISIDSEELNVVSSNSKVLAVGKGESKIFIAAISKGEAVIKMKYGNQNPIKRSFIVLNENERLFPQSHLVGQFPNGIN